MLHRKNARVQILAGAHRSDSARVGDPVAHA